MFSQDASGVGDHMLVELPDAKHYIHEDAPERITEAIRDRFG